MSNTDYETTIELGIKAARENATMPTDNNLDRMLRYLHEGSRSFVLSLGVSKDYTPSSLVLEGTMAHPLVGDGTGWVIECYGDWTEFKRKQFIEVDFVSCVTSAFLTKEALELKLNDIVADDSVLAPEGWVVEGKDNE